MALAPLATPAETYALMQSIATAARAAGYQKIVVLTCLPRVTGGNGNFESDRQAFNTLLRAGYASFADALADVAADSRIGDAGDNADLTYYQADQVHLNDTGRAIISAAVKAALDLLI